MFLEVSGALRSPSAHSGQPSESNLLAWRFPSASTQRGVRSVHMETVLPEPKAFLVATN